MKKCLFSFVFIITIAYFFFVHLPSPVQAAPIDCVKLNSSQSCNATHPCCNPVANQQVICLSAFSGGGGKTGPVAASVCAVEKPGVNCGKLYDACGGIGSKVCCGQNDTGNPVECNSTTHQCEPANSNSHTQCSAEKAPCGGANGSCCKVTDPTTKNPLTCLDSSGQPTASDGTCHFAALTDTKGNQTVNCHCDNPNVAKQSQNGFWCDGQVGTYRIYCAASDSACQQDPNNTVYLGNLTMVVGTNSDYDTNFKGHTAKGVTCAPKADPTFPPPPSPPCVQGGWINGQCSSFVTALGNLDTDPAGFTAKIFAILLSFSGGIALLLIIRAGYVLLTSQGKPEQVQSGRDQLIAAIVGLVFLIFSLVLLQIIGYDILKIPGLTADSTAGKGCKTNADCTQGLVCGFNGTTGKCQ